MTYRAAAVFNGVYATVPEGFRPANETVYVPAAMSTGSSYILGLAKVTADGDVKLFSNGQSTRDATFSISYPVG